MTRKMLNEIISQNNYLEGGTKEACVKVREFLLHSRVTDSEVSAPHSSVNAKEFVESIQILLSAAFANDDEIPETWHCDPDCKFISAPFCRGECNTKKNAPTLCPYFTDDSLV